LLRDWRGRNGGLVHLPKRDLLGFRNLIQEIVNASTAAVIASTAAVIVLSAALYTEETALYAREATTKARRKHRDNPEENEK
jgi:hypothetical protein